MVLDLDIKLLDNFYYWLYSFTHEKIECNSTVNKHKSIVPDSNNYCWNVFVRSYATYIGLHHNGIQKVYEVPSQKKMKDIISNVNRLRDTHCYNLYIPLLEPFDLDTNICQSVDFTGCKWPENDIADFSNFLFYGDVQFTSMIFTQKVSFFRASFYRGGMPSGLEHHLTFSSVSFDSAIFEAEVNFVTAHLNNFLSFENAEFNGNVFFLETYFSDSISFDRAVFKKNITFTQSKIPFRCKISFVEAFFKGDVNYFTMLEVEGHISYLRAIFEKCCNFSGSDFRALLRLSGTEFRSGIDLSGAHFSSTPLGFLSKENALNSWRKLRDYTKNNIELEKYFIENEFEVQLEDMNQAEQLKTKRSWIGKEWNKIFYVLLFMTMIGQIFVFIDVIVHNILDLGVVFSIISIILTVYFWKKIIFSLYGFLSNYGTCFLRPIFLWGLQILIFGKIYSFIGNGHSPYLKSLSEASIFVPLSDNDYYNYLICENFKIDMNASCINNNKSLRTDVKLHKNRFEKLPLIQNMQRSISAILSFLFFLGLRFNFKMK